MRVKIYTLILLIFIPVVFASPGLSNPALEFHWPIEKGTLPALRGITSSFGESRLDHFHNGVDIASGGDPVHAMASGHLIYSRDTQDDPYNPEPGPGNYVFMDHGEGWWSGYYHMIEPLRADGHTMIAPGSIIGKTGNTGHSGGFHLHFFLMKDNGLTIVNPMQMLPEALDENPPVIGQITIITPKGRTQVSHSRRENIRLTKAYPVLLNVVDPGLEKSTKRGIYRLKWKLNDGAEQSLLFSNLKFTDGDWKLEGRSSIFEVYNEDLYNLGVLPFISGANTIRVTAEDLKGNSTTVVFEIHVDTVAVTN